MSKTLTVKDRPESSLGLDPVIETDDDLDAVLHELSFLNALNQSVNARISEQTEAIKQKYKSEKVIAGCIGEKGGADNLVTVDSRVKQLTQLAEKYCRANKKKMIKGKAKSKKFPHGTVSFNKQRDGVDYETGVDVEASFSMLDELLKSSLVQMITAWLKSICLFGKDKEARVLYEVIELNPRYNFTKLKAAYDEERLTDAHLKQLGLKISKGKDKVKVKPAEYAPG